MSKFIKSRLASFHYAFQGWRYVIGSQPNAWVHALASVCVLLLGLWLTLPARDWAVLALTIALVWSAEFLNTSIEAVVDLVSPTQHPLAKISKDVGAAAVLIASGAALLVGLLILGPPLWEKILSLEVP